MSRLFGISATLCLTAISCTWAMEANFSINLTPKLEQTKEWWQHATFYQLYPRSFKDSDGNGIGDIRGIIEKLQHLKDIGITAAWLSPVFESPQVDFGYDVADFYKIEPAYGTMADLDELIDRAHSLGIKLMLDFIPNHTSDLNQWFKDSVANVGKYSDYYVWRDGKLNETGQRIPPNNWVSVFGGSAWEWNDSRQKYYLHQFSKQQPDLNYRNPEVVNEMTGVIKYYLDKGIDGFRLDAINHMFEDTEFRDEPLTGWTDDVGSYDYLEHIYTKDVPEVYDVIYNWRDLLDTYRISGGARILMTEAYADTEHTMRYYQSDDGRRKGAHMPFNFALIHNFESQSSAQQIKSGIDGWLDFMPPGNTAPWVIGSHDHHRVASRLGQERIDLLNTIVMTLPGTSITYYGEEIGMRDGEMGQIFDNRDPERTPMQWDNTVSGGFSTNSNTWLPVNSDYTTVNVKAQAAAEISHMKYYIELSNLRKENTMIYGDYNSKAIGSKIFAYLRELRDHDTYVVIVNIGDRDETVDLSIFANLPEKLTVVTAGTASKHKSGDEVNAKNLSLGKYDSLVLRASAASFGKLSLGLLILIALKCILI